MTFTLRFALVSIPITLGACASSAPTGTEDSADAVIDGETSSGARALSSIGLCLSPLNQDPAAGPIGACIGEHNRCSGTLIAPNLVLTARHCITTAQDDGNGGTRYVLDPVTEFRATTASTVVGEGVRWTQVKKTLAASETGDWEQDIAVAILAKNLPGHRAAEPDLARNVANDRPREVVVQARGMLQEEYRNFNLDTFDYDYDFVTGDFRRRVREHVSFLCAFDHMPCRVDTPEDAKGYQDFAVGTFTTIEMLGAGDSGGSVFDQREWDKSLRPKVIGVAVASALSSGNTTSQGGRGNASIHVRLDKHAAFLKAAAAEAAKMGSYPLPRWAK